MLRFRLLPFLLLIGSAGFGSSPSAGEPPRRPNILFAFADDMGRHAGAYAALEDEGGINDIIRTPHFDRLAREGVLFTRAFVGAPSCTPCRSSLLSGQYFWRTGRGAILIGAVWDERIPTYPLLLREAGYHIGYSYKVWTPGTPPHAPHGGQRFAYHQAGTRLNRFSQIVSERVAAGDDKQAAKQALYDEARGNFDAFLADREAGQAFCYWFGPTNPHRTWTRGSGRALWGIDPDALQGRMPPFLPDVPEVREDLADYFGEIQAFDAALGALLARLEEIGELDNTLVIVSGDHGAPGFPHGKCNLYDFGTHVPLVVRGSGLPGGRVVHDFVNLMDLAPTFLEAGGLEPPEEMTGNSLWGLLRSDRQGQVDPSRNFVITGRERHVENARAGNLPYPQRALRTADYLYIVNFRPERWPMGDPLHRTADPAPTPQQIANNTRATYADMDAGPTRSWLIANGGDPKWHRHYELAFGKRPREELYILADDPHQVRNVAEDPRYAGIKQRLHDRLMAELRRTGDPRVVDDGAYFENPPLAGPSDR